MLDALSDDLAFTLFLRVSTGATAEDALTLLAEGEESPLQLFPILMPIEAGRTMR